MADTTNDAGSAALNLTPEEKRVFGQLFRQADTENIGVVTGEAAIKFFERTRLEPRVLGEIWQIADKENRGLLTPVGFGVVMRLIGHFQAGREPTPELAFRPAPLPRFDGGPPGGAIQPPPGPPPIAALQPQASGGGPVRIPPLTPDKVNQYAGLFDKSGAVNGILPAEQAKTIFERAGLPNETLGKIWALADVEQRGALNVTEFTIAMHLLASSKSGQLRGLPNVLPPGLYDAASRRPASRQMTGSGPMAPQLTGIPRQFTGQQAQRTGSPLGRSAFGAPPLSGQNTGNDWIITPMDKQRFDSIYAGLDRANKGFITGDEAVPFFSESKLPEEVLAQIWDLADINSEGHLNRDEFAVAMHLIRQQRGKRDGRDTLPATLPPNLIPPSMRNQVRPPMQATAPDFETGAPQMPKSAADDLFGLDALSSPGPSASVSAPTQIPVATGDSSALGTDPFGNPKSPPAPISPSPLHAQGTGFGKPFVPSSSFGQALTYSATGGSNVSNAQQNRSVPPPQPSAMDDLLTDVDPDVSKNLTNETSELANLSNQVGNLSNQMQEVQGQRATSQNDLNNASSQKRDFELRLSQLRSLYEKELKDVNSLKERLQASRAETTKLAQEMAMVEGSYQDLQTQHQQVNAALQADLQENANLKERMRFVNAEIAQIKPQLEKLRSEARQQKGLVAINKKQLSTSEGERDKLKTEEADLNKSIEEDTRAIAEHQSMSRVASPTRNVVSPAPSAMSVNNPFFRRTSESAGSTLASPAAQPQTDRSFDSVFGPSFETAPASSHGPPPTSFVQEAPGDIEGPTSTLPIHTSEVSDLHTPTASPPPTSSPEPSAFDPPPAESHQIGSGSLPFPFGGGNSLTSSRQVSAPASRFGEESEVNTPIGSSAEGHTDATASAAHQIMSGNHNEIPGAFPGDEHSNVIATPTGGSTLSENAIADPFAAPAEKSVSSKDDFDSAFAGFGGPSKPQERMNTGDSFASFGSQAKPANNSEFPPIAELEHDDESDSASEVGGFDDDFGAGSPSHIRQESGGFPAPPATEATPAAAPPAAESFPSPPAYDKAVSPIETKSADHDQFEGLLPSREDPTTSGPSSTEHTFNGEAPSTGGQSLFGANQGGSLTNPVQPPKDAFDDFDNEFDDLEEAKEGDADDDFATALERSGTEDFNPMFDSPAASKSDHAAQNSSSGFSDFGHPAAPTAPQASTDVAAPGSMPQENHDWDAIFAGLEKPPAADASSAFPSVGEQAEAPGQSNGTSLAPAKDERPQMGRALTEAGEHDDPILKSLTSIGYPRDKALAALEKYDYNLQRAANHLAETAS